MRCFIKIILTIVCLIPVNASALELKGDAEAVALADKMIDRLGGKEVWSGARSLYLEYSGWRADTSQPVDERAWRDVQQPIQHVIFESRSGDVSFNMTPETSWLEFSNRPARVFNEEEHANNLNFWNFDFYTIIHNLARGDDRLRLRFEEPQTIHIEGPGGADWGWFEIDQTGQPVRWGAPDGDDEFEYIYGPVKAYGNINFPAWGTASNGFWRFDYHKVDVSRYPFNKELTPPEGN
ncbi:hypothetical protein PUV54_04825 [Hyphococcus flavus]|uniref:Uncharacterized protein n=1 Tax=Hyphococcus flavus TaxID=1866326 RepID=A0AAF0CI50_9PROT|nr:hypothetical protein [Hyphococcus flavus]WDI32517.1 hypothetical protein PUV54_04825 [Hyphococcus flavus]